MQKLLFEGIEEKWKRQGANPILGTDYDFVPELKGELITNFICHVPERDYSRYKYKAVVAHEFGHTLGLGDAYPGANGGKVLINNAEISDGEFGKTGSIMFRNGIV